MSEDLSDQHLCVLILAKKKAYVALLNEMT